MGIIFHSKTRGKDLCTFAFGELRLGFSATCDLGAGFCCRITHFHETNVHD